MSAKGIAKFASAMYFLQRTRCELLGMSNKQDIYLGQLCHDMKELVVDRFVKETLDIDNKKLLGG